MPEIEILTPPVDGAEVQTPAAEQEEKVTFDERQQAKITEIIKKASARAGAEARAEAERLKQELQQVKAKLPAETPDTALELATTRAELAALKSAQQESALKDSLRAAVGNGFVDADLAVQILRNQVKIGTDGKPVAIDADGNERLGDDFAPLSLQALAAELAQSKPFLARGSVRSGSGSTPAQSHASTLKISEYFGKGATKGAELHRLARVDKARYHQMREQARREGLVR